jgi:hypothetical protein
MPWLEIQDSTITNSLDGDVTLYPKTHANAHPALLPSWRFPPTTKAFLPLLLHYRTHKGSPCEFVHFHAEYSRPDEFISCKEAEADSKSRAWMTLYSNTRIREE